MRHRELAGKDLFTDLLVAVERHRPGCENDPRFTDDEIPTSTRAELHQICQACPILTECAEFARASRPTGGFWPGFETHRANG